MSFADILIAFVLLALAMVNCCGESSQALVSYELGFVKVSIEGK